MTLKQKIKDMFFNKSTHTTVVYQNGDMPQEDMDLLTMPLGE